MSTYCIDAQDINEDDFEQLSQTSNQSQFKFKEDLESNYENDSDYLPSSKEFFSQDFLKVKLVDYIWI